MVLMTISLLLAPTLPSTETCTWTFQPKHLYPHPLFLCLDHSLPSCHTTVTIPPTHPRTIHIPVFSVLVLDINIPINENNCNQQVLECCFILMRFVYAISFTWHTHPKLRYLSILKPLKCDHSPPPHAASVPSAQFCGCIYCIAL